MDSSSVGIKDVAREAGVSVTTVSHVLNNVPSARVSPETREKVRTTAVRLGYGPNRLARALRSRRSGVLGLVVEDAATTPHAGRIILGADQAARARGYTLMMATIPGQSEPDAAQAGVESLLAGQVDGILYSAAGRRVLPIPFRPGGVPTVLVDAITIDGSLPAVMADEYGGAAAGAAALVAAGHYRIGFLTTRDENPSTHQRLLGFRDALQRAGMAGAATTVAAASPDAPGGYAAARSILAGGNPPSALLCCNDRLAMGAYRAAAERGLSIPDHLSVVGFGDVDLLAANLHPQLTSVALPYYGMGTWAANRLIDAIELQAAEPGTRQHHDRLDPVLLACRLVNRGSVAAPGTPAPQA
ncbi:LacI family DNA-binding transcriptional regulator [Pseudarthrobacter sp. C4D7]|uniref:LacI family DNA-binding transcriptional regulator n=1 Tax=Pseudarthrobacter sp. C4D7 TaxID=2735268 RepID=UPI001584D880|nr:LacI family DNA-binding transcriptional regulator [Pseudarthrobacter sp. C4D7]NUT71481.1 LacI family DNA-binding transcriptional regulator [Pseudarthrobacter sp. C4D7]